VKLVSVVVGFVRFCIVPRVLLSSGDCWFGKRREGVVFVLLDVTLADGKSERYGTSACFRESE